MSNTKITRKEFLKIGFSGIIALLAIPLLKKFSFKGNVSHKDARHYKNLAG